MIAEVHLTSCACDGHIHCPVRACACVVSRAPYSTSELLAGGWFLSSGHTAGILTHL